MTCVPAANLHISAGVASFDFCGVHIETPVLRTITLTGFTNQASQHPVIALMITVGAHTAREEIALSLPGTTILVGRTFMAGRIIVNPDKRW